ncbi:hypothetical protein [Nocardia aurea]|uniref:hypothetical protein n=1 Tax=Nocardia aurea TaxID=2144174 RepID=UPI000D68EBA9|nr:hypothetical protein [Nocardia aurea]
MTVDLRLRFAVDDAALSRLHADAFGGDRTPTPGKHGWNSTAGHGSARSSMIGSSDSYTRYGTAEATVGAGAS